jgi:hypothetical protein
MIEFEHALNPKASSTGAQSDRDTVQHSAIETA